VHASRPPAHRFLILAVKTVLLLVALVLAPAADAACGSGDPVDVQYKEAFAAAIVRVLSVQPDTQALVYIDGKSARFDGPVPVLVAETEMLEQLKGGFSGPVSIIVPAPGHKCHASIELGQTYVVFSPGLSPVITPDGAPLPLQHVSPRVLSQWRHQP
jgi:hypothetical protein